jgi:cytosine/adenosine deaminase-related metal-dependent hydrolase
LYPFQRAEMAMPMTAFRAARILTMNPADPVIIDGGVLVDGNRIVAVGEWRRVSGHGEPRDFGRVTLVPGLINAHTHLELSHLAGKIPAGLGFPGWADRLFGALRGQRPEVGSLERAVASAKGSGTCFVADVVGREAAAVRMALDAHALGGHLFREFSGRRPVADMEARACPGAWSPSVHALYSTGSELAGDLKAWCSTRGLPFSLHLAEVPGENELFLGRGGDFEEFLRARRILPKGFEPPGMSVVAYAHDLGLLDADTMAVHCAQAGPGDVEILAGSGTCVCLCPRSNAWIGVGLPPAVSLRAAGVPMCLGTDSLASNASLDLWEDLRALRALLPADTPLFELLAAVTVTPARFLGIDAEYGRLEAGRNAVWAVLPEDFASMP